MGGSDISAFFCFFAKYRVMCCIILSIVENAVLIRVTSLDRKWKCGVFVCSMDDLANITQCVLNTLRPQLLRSTSSDEHRGQRFLQASSLTTDVSCISLSPSLVVSHLHEMGFHLPHIQQALSSTGIIYFVMVIHLLSF